MTSGPVQAIGLYISVPFCRSKCSFCNFASNVYGVEHHGRYVERVCQDLRNSRRRAQGIGAYLPSCADSIYLGGGTPSVLEASLLHQLFAAIRSAFRVSGDAEITMECAPGQIDDAVLAAIVECGVNRVSLGVQSFIDREAATTGRLHNREVALRDIERLRAAGIGRISVDLIAGLPHQTLDSWQQSLEVLTGTGVEHASIYMLEVDDESRLGKELLNGGARYHAGAVPKDDTIATMFEMAPHALSRYGMEQYEISNYAVPGQESKHNLKYWARQPYLGVGLDAHSMLQHAEGGRGVRFNSTDDLREFMEGAADWREVDHLTARAALEEAWFLGLRVSAGVSQESMERTFGTAAFERYLPVIGELVEGGVIETAGDWIRLTSRGKLISNDVFGRILEAGDEEFCLAN
jgi:oxygen-independent coproporphyrinogen-3 oxidase